MRRLASRLALALIGAGLAALVLHAAGLLVSLALSWNAKVVIAPGILDLIVMAGLFATPVGFLLGSVAFRGRHKLYPLGGLVLGFPAVFVLLVVLTFATGFPGVVNRVEVSGRTFMLGVDPQPTDTVYAIWEAVDPIRLVWRDAAEGKLNYSEDGSFTESPSLVATPDGKRLLIRRGGLWTDCLEIVEPLELCPGVSNHLNWTAPDSWTAQSKHIQSVTGLPPQ